MRLDPHFTVNDLNLPARQCAAHVRLTVSLFRADGRGKLRQAIATKRRNTLRRALSISNGDVAILWDSNVAKILLVLAIVVVVVPPVLRLLRRQRKPQPDVG